MYSLQLSPEQLAEWKKGVKPLHDSWANDVKKAGADPAKVWGDLEAAIKKFDAGL